MKIKVRPEDFVVSEQAPLTLSPHPGAYTVFRLRKRGWDTFDLIELLARQLAVPGQDISMGGIKDRHADTEQLISIRTRRGLQEAVEALPPQPGFSLDFLGYRPAAISAKDVLGNRFAITIRDIHPRDLERLLAAARAAAEQGVPNYYDDQRFGSARHGKGFMGKEIFRGSREKALRLFFEPAKHDDRKTRALKSRVVDNWGHWECCLEGAFGEYRRILAYLAAHRRAFHKALSLLDRRFLVFVLGAYQSFLFNRILGSYLADLQREHRLSFDQCSYSQGRLLFYRRLPEALFERLRAQTLPVPGWDSSIEDPRIAAIAAEVLRSEGMAMEDLKVRQISRLYINGIHRPALLLPEELSASDVGDDELYRGRKKMTLRFFLSRGGYATLIVKRLQAAGS